MSRLTFYWDLEPCLFGKQEILLAIFIDFNYVSSRPDSDDHCLLTAFPKNVRHNARALKLDSIEWNERSEASLVCFTLSFLPRLDNGWCLCYNPPTMLRRYHHHKVYIILYCSLKHSSGEGLCVGSKWWNLYCYTAWQVTGALSFSLNSAWEIYWWEQIETSNYFALILFVSTVYGNDVCVVKMLRGRRVCVGVGALFLRLTTPTTN